ncbi:MAG: hypothetical protein PHV17_07015 [Candidatus Omnitrophica bacterium]|nr:hypothetical protein [Candidatus Omnitrophota bacterium]
MKKQVKSQMVLFYAALIAFVITALLVLFPYIQQRVQGSYQTAGDAFGEGEQLN